MWKPLVVLAIVANTALITPSAGTYATGPYSKKSVDGNPHRKCKKPNEIYDLCPNPCPPRECGVDITVILCAPAPKPGSKDCKPGCRCADGFLKNRAGICIPEDECQYDCAKNETLDQCYSDCPRRFCGVNIAAESCLAIDESDCERGCRCSDGYLENAEGDCILEKDCLYDVCPAPCPPRRCDVDETLIDCKPWARPGHPECEPGCRCADGFVRNPDGVCVTRDQCPKCYGRNEMYDVCPNPCPPQRCDVDPRVIRCPAPPEPGDPKCKPGCRCLDGYARNDDGICIPREKCPQNSCKGENEIYSECPAFTCRPLNCSQVGFPVPCPIPGPDPSRCPGKPGCICESGYARNKDGKCIPLKQCTPKCGKDEVYSTCTNSDCGPQKCSQLGYPIACPIIDPDYCIKGCVCREGLVRDANGTCIPKEKCPSCGGDLNAESGCGNNCGRLCSNYNSSEPVICPEICILNGCDCKKGFVLDESTGKCIPPNKCVSCNGDFNAKPGCDKSCTKRCPGTKAAECICKGSCECKDGFVYDPKIRKCLRPEQCTPPCGENEILSNCSNGGCGPWRCTDVGIPTGCVKMDQKYCKVDCVCKEGYVRDDKEVCVPVTDCPECGGDPNAIAGCGINCGRLCSNYKFAENVSCIAVCYDNACDCRKGFVLDENINKCVKPKHCTPVCKKHEVYSECINGGCQPRNCSQLGQPVPCVKLDPKSCIKGCVCEDGYLRARNGTCVPKDKCETPPCGDNEILSNCSNGGCGPWRCTDVGIPTGCVKMDQKYCKVDCVCKEGSVRDDKEVCVPVTDCPECGGDPNAIAGCGVNCGRLCSNYKFAENVSCIDVCYDNACDCRKGFVLDENINKCVKPKHCTPTCGKNEVFSECINGGCDAKNCSQIGKPVPCVRPAKCKPGCLCAEGYLRDAKGNCIPKDQCSSPVCKMHEVYSECINGGCQPRNCSQLGQPVPCVKLDPKSCIKGCVCEDGYLRARNGTCVPEDKCDNCNKPHEHYDPCAPSCPPQTCESIKRKKYKCPPTAAVCKGACRCDKGYLRNKIGECISEKKCLKCKGPHEYWSCGSACDNVCATLYKQNQTNCPIDNSQCTKMCYCEKGYARDKNNVCIPINKCPKPKCGENERLEECPPALCTPQKCSELGFPIACPDLPKDGTCPEPPGCVCADNYVRDSSGKCIPSNSCPSCGGDPKAVSGCGVNCGRTCTTYNRTDVVCIAICYFNACDCRKGYVFDDNIKRCVKPKDCTRPCGKNEVYTSCANGGCGKWNCSQLGQPDLCIDPMKCIGGCICQEGYLRAKNGTCVPRNQCPVPSCGKNERFEFCPGSECEPQYCSELGLPLTCPATIGDSGCSGEPACICNNGFVRNESGDCIPKKKCPSCGGDPNAESGCGVNCGRLCSNYNKGPVPCPKICRINACDCKKDFVLDQNINKCVRPKQCTPICGQDEVFSECINGGCQPKNCSQLGKPVPCPKIDEKDCIKGCLCKEGYLRDLNGVCVPKEKCEQQCSGQNEVYDPCPPTCPPQTCESIDRIYDCPLMKNNKPNCKPSCRCKEGYYRNKIGQCISKANCLKCKGPYEYWSCGGACDNVCKDLHKQNQTNCPIKNIKCNEKCYCEKGYARNAKNVCVPIDQCPPPKCGKNERLEECPDWLCRPQSCDQLGYPVACPALQGEISSNATCPGRPGCICIDNYVRHDCGECIPVDECSSCGGDPNAVSGCGVNCGRLCSNYKQKNVFCPLYCNLNGCDCKKGFVFDSNIGKCVLPKDCTKVCGNNEVYDICANGGCQKRNCSQFGGRTLCIDPIKCVGGCVCQEGFLRNKDGDCVPEDQCPSPCTKPHEVYDPCPRTCPPQTCAAIGFAYPCPHPPEGKQFCNPACRCEDGYYKNSADECISEEDCLKCTGPNEHFSCGPICDNVCAKLATENQTNCPYINKRCNSKCYCDKGYARDDNNICIPINQCGVSCNGDPNAISGCGGHCGNRCSNYKKGPVVCPLICKLNGCNCKQSYVFDDNLGKCVQPKNCTPVCGKDEVYNTCINGGCQKKKCSDLARPIICIHPKECKDGCLCKEGMLRADNGTCVPIDDCPTPVCPKNEVFERCANGGCDRRKCSDLTRPVICINPAECIGDCVCVKGFLRNEDGICVPECECNPQCNKPHQVFNPCPSSCPPQTCESLDRAYICPIEWGQEPPCQPKCVCEQGYFFNLIGECISEENCLKCMGPHEYFSCGVECDNVCATLSVQSKTNCPIVNIQCSEQCYCEDGYARNKSNICIPIEDCPVTETCYGEHKVFDPCPKTPRTCASLNNGGTCNSDSSSEEEPPCKPGCVCEEGYYENAIGECSTKEECLKCTGPHEFYSCGGACDNVCLTLNEQSQTDCPIVNIKCNEMCYCEGGYARNASKICIPIKDCPPSRCGPNERYEENPCQVCGPITCSEVDMELECPPAQDDNCDDTPACICKYGLVRNEAGVCIPISECCE